MTYDQNSMRGRESSFGSTREQAGANASQTADEVQRRTQEKLDDSRERTASGLDSMVSAADAAAEDLREHNQEGLSRYVSEIADSVASVAGSLRHKSVDELIHEVEAIARKNPTLFLAGSLAVGLGIGRFARSSSRHAADGAHYRQGDSTEANSADEKFPRNVSGDADPERAGHDSARVTEDDYLADDYAAAGGESTGFENGDLSDSDLLADSDSEPTVKQKARQVPTGNGNQLI